MPDRPQPGKDKDLRHIRQALDEADAAFDLLSTEIEQNQSTVLVEPLSEVMLLLIEQYDLLNQMLDNPELSASTVLDCNRYIRDLLKLMIQEKLSPESRATLLSLIQSVGSQLRLLFITKEIRG